MWVRVLLNLVIMPFGTEGFQITERIEEARFWERQSQHTVFSHPFWLGHIRMGLEPWTLFDQQIRACAGFIILYGNIFPCFTLSTLLFCLSMCIIWHLSSSTGLSVLCGDGTGSFLWGTREVCILPTFAVAGRALLAIGHCPLLKLIFLCLFSILVKSQSSAWLCCVFLGDFTYWWY